jgi:hypothetical protein
VRHIIIGQEENQTVYVYVTNQWQQPVEGVTVAIVAHYPSNDAIYECEPTDEDGFTRSRFSIPPSPPGQKVVIDITVRYDDLTGSTQVFFLPWW